MSYADAAELFDDIRPDFFEEAPPRPAPDRTASRFGEVEREAIRKAIAEAWPGPNGWDSVPAAERVGRHAIGCTAADLRESELAEVAAIAREVLGLDQ